MFLTKFFDFWSQKIFKRVAVPVRVHSNYDATLKKRPSDAYRRHCTPNGDFWTGEVFGEAEERSQLLDNVNFVYSHTLTDRWKWASSLVFKMAVGGTCWRIAWQHPHAAPVRCNRNLLMVQIEISMQNAPHCSHRNLKSRSINCSPIPTSAFKILWRPYENHWNFAANIRGVFKF